LLLEEELKSRFANVNTVASIIEKNTVMAGEVLKAINSPIMKIPEPVKSIKEALIKSLGLWASQIFSIKASFRRRMSIRQEKRTQRLGIWLSPLRAGL
jgi:HD-like signal output (HDOD) protein